jgi:hypothetical protein
MSQPSPRGELLGISPWVFRPLGDGLECDVGHVLEPELIVGVDPEACHVLPGNDPSVAYRSKYPPPPWVADHATAFREDPSSSS